MHKSLSETSNKQIWIIGCGDIGRRVAKLYANGPLEAIVSSMASVNLCEKLSINAKAISLDEDYSIDPESFQDAAVYYFAPPTQTGQIDKRLAVFLDKVGSAPRRIVVISTTGVYGDSQGAWIDENTPPKPVADRALRRLSAESSVHLWAGKTGKEFMILRVPGIYATDRLPLSRLQKGLPVIHEAEAGWTNRIHADDLAQACKAAMECESSNQIINVTDGNPSTMTDYFNHVADFAGLSRPAQISLEEAGQTLSEGMLSYMKESRRIKNEKMLRLLKIKLKYPDLQAGIRRSP
jgi:nucleoside-diphosphate-sugar epimerase